ncbi:NifU family protein [Halorubrum ezzemoulense]|uniref:Fe-S cluster biogenesis protein NfuA, 4Fe-4S-binding domain n=3 Tax=Halorubrum TaxID=56688 RepID=A0A256IVS9_HALEZ|nr:MULTISPECIES: NifU family protein [Halorubrum]MDB2224741.1 NifU family protein [Halorubrum ezzemoulense]MDB2238588.1 NifU family protein [Halorubrum ezzemoulense]MDB2242254.1 NifU family protein [Halorubrum ezzemoulense]MDB2246038.1 NifU family protein [Halorubrum ezzemoulense]MDB2249219.1 NifU family protein [Halorubrum ezzemoulense]
MSDESDESLADRVERWMVGQMPIIQMHGGTSVVREANPETGEVVVELGGTCSGCGISNITADNIRRDLIMDFDEVDNVTVRTASSGDQGASTVEGGRGGELRHETDSANHF